MVRVVFAFVLLGMFGVAPNAWGQETASPSHPPRWLAELQLGGAHVMHTRSKAVGHLFKPQMSLSLRRFFGGCYEVGGTVLALLDQNEHYRVLGFQATLRRNLLVGQRFSWGALLGLGAGYNADILQSDLNARAPVAFYGSVGTDVRWRLRGVWQVGGRAELVNLALANVGLLMGRHF